MSRHILPYLLCLAILGFAGQARADMVLVSGNSMDSSNPTFVNNLNKLSHTFTFVNPANFASTDLSGFDAIWLDGFSLYTSAALARLTPFLLTGKTVLVQNPGFGSEPISDYPFTAGLTATLDGPGTTVHVVTPGDPINAGLTDANLSNWAPASRFGMFVSVPATYTILTDDGTSNEVVSIVKTTGPGRLVYTEQGISQSLSASDLPLSSGQLTFLNNVLTSAVPEPSSFLLAGIVVLGTGLSHVLRRRHACRESS